MSFIRARNPSTPEPIGRPTSPPPEEKAAEGETNWVKRGSVLAEGVAAHRTASTARSLRIACNSPIVWTLSKPHPPGVAAEAAKGATNEAATNKVA
jgi:hypothetical protein